MVNKNKPIREEDFAYLANRHNPDGEFEAKLYTQCNAKRGLRNADGTGIVAGLTRISNVHGYLINEFERVPVDGELCYRGISVADIVDACRAEDRFGYEEASWLLLFGELPSKDDLALYRRLIGLKNQTLLNAIAWPVIVLLLIDALARLWLGSNYIA